MGYVHGEIVEHDDGVGAVLFEESNQSVHRLAHHLCLVMIPIFRGFGLFRSPEVDLRAREALV